MRTTGLVDCFLFKPVFPSSEQLSPGQQVVTVLKLSRNNKGRSIRSSLPLHLK